MIFADARLQSNLKSLFTTETGRFDELIVAAGLDPRTELVGADLRGAIFTGSILDGWNLSECDLTGASFRGARIRNLITDGAVGVDLDGAEPFDGNADSSPRNDLDQLIAKVEQAKKGADRWSALKRILELYVHEPRAKQFLLQHVKRERVAANVERIITAGARAWGWSKAASDELRIALLRVEGGSQFLTVRAALLRTLALSVGPRDDVFAIAEELARSEGWWSSGRAALAVLGRVFAGQSRAADILRDLIASEKWSGSNYDVVAAFFDGFEPAEVREYLKQVILDERQSGSHRGTVLLSYSRHEPTAAGVADLVAKTFLPGMPPELRAAAARLRMQHGALSAPAALGDVKALAINDRDGAVRAVAVAKVGERAGAQELDWLRKRAVLDESPSVRSQAIFSLLHGSTVPDEEEFLLEVIRSDLSDDVRRSAIVSFFPTRALANINMRRLRAAFLNELARPQLQWAAFYAGTLLARHWPADPTVESSIWSALDRFPPEQRWMAHQLRRSLRAAQRASEH